MWFDHDLWIVQHLLSLQVMELHCTLPKTQAENLMSFPFCFVMRLCVAFLQIREAMEFENLAKQYLTHLIKQECWDTMEVKGRSIEVGQLNKITYTSSGWSTGCAFRAQAPPSPSTKRYSRINIKLPQNDFWRFFGNYILIFLRG